MPPKKSTSAAATAQPASSSPTTTTTAPGDTSILSTTTAAGAEPKSPTTTKPSRKSQSDDIGIDDLTLPRSLTSRIARGILPPNTSLQKDAILAITKSATVFISALAAEANEATSRKTIQAGDVLKALREMEFDGVMKIRKGGVGAAGGTGGGIGGGGMGDGSSRIERELEMFETSVRGKRKGYREKVKMRESGGGDVGGKGEGEERGGDGEPLKKRVRRGSQDEDEEEVVEDEEEDLLNRQLNGSNGVNGHERGDEEMVDGEGEGEGEGDGNETEDDPNANDEDDGEDDEVEDDDDEQDGGNESGEEDRVDVEESPQKKNRYVLAPDGRAEVGSEDESD